MSSSTFPIRKCSNYVRPLVDSEETYNRIVDAVEHAKYSIWISISFFSSDFKPDGKRTIWEILFDVANQGIDVRILFWRNLNFFNMKQFIGSKKELEFLKVNEAKVKIRWDDTSNDYEYCHHEKSWIIDAGQETEVCFIGGITLTGHIENIHHFPYRNGKYHNVPKHDTFCEIQGPAATDYHHHFVMRWNYSVGHEQTDGNWPSIEITNDLQWPEKLTGYRGNSSVQIIRNIRPDNYHMDSNPIGINTLYDITKGESSILNTYLKAIENAKSFIYIENQHICHEGVLNALVDALERGVYISYIVPSKEGIARLMNYVKGEADSWERNKVGDKPRYADIYLEYLPKLASYDNFCLIGLYNGNFIYVHSKLAIIDDEWLCIGSANIVDLSLERDHTEVCVSISNDIDTISSLRIHLIDEHSGNDTSNISALESIILLNNLSRENKELFIESKQMNGHVLSLDPIQYGSEFYKPWEVKLIRVAVRLYKRYDLIRYVVSNPYLLKYIILTFLTFLAIRILVL